MMDGGMSGPDGGAEGGPEGGAGPGDASPTVVAKVCDLGNVTLLVSNTSGKRKGFQKKKSQTLGEL